MISVYVVPDKNYGLSIHHAVVTHAYNILAIKGEYRLYC